MPILQIHKTKHNCDLRDNDESVLPNLPPQMGNFQKWLHKLRRHFIASGSNRRIEFVYRSLFTLRAEKRRQIRKYPWYIIHPFSNFYYYNEIIMTIVWGFAFIKDPLTTAYLSQEFDIAENPWQLVDLIFDMLQMCHVGLCFITGYFKYNTKEVILNPKLIVREYTRTYFSFDLLGCLPMSYIYFLFIKDPAIRHKYEIIPLYLGFFRFFRLARIKTLVYYSRQITYAMGVSDSNHTLLIMLILAFYIFHWGACGLVLLPRCFYFWFGRINTKSWLSYIKGSSQYTYLMAFNIIMCHFISAGPGEFVVEDILERALLIFVCIIGVFYVAVALTVILVNVSTRGSSETKYEELLHQLREYAKRKKLPLVLRTQLEMYYEHRFQRHYFKENEILDVLSPFMKYQITLHSCKYLLDKVTLFSGLSKRVIGTIVASLEYEVYLPSDVVMKADEFEGCVYFIAYGTLAAYNRDGIELRHITDGEFFGAILLLYPDQNRVKTVIALETTEIYRLNKDDFLYCMSNFEDFQKRVQQTVARDIELMDHLEKQITESKMRKADILFDLRKGRILERSRHRRKEICPV